MYLLNKKSEKIVFAVLSSVLLWAAWPAAGFAPLLFIGFVPLLLIEDKIVEEKKSGTKIRLFPYVYLTFFLFNLLTTWWIYFASPFGMAGAVSANALLMTLIFLLFHKAHQKTNDFIAYASLISFWLCFEYLHMNWDLTWPWLTLGNGFASWANMVQWYEYTGVAGGAIWIWLANILFFKLIKSDPSSRKKIISQLSLLIFLPLLISFLIRSSYKEKSRPVEVVVVQPNIDPYNEKFSGLSGDEQLEKILRLSSTLVSNKTRLVVCPETALSDGIWEEDIEHHSQIEHIRNFIRPYPGLRFLTGLTSLKLYPEGQEAPATARTFHDSPAKYDVYNAGIQITNNSPLQLYHKSKLVPGVEKLPYPAVFGLLGSFAIDLGGTSGSLGSQESAGVFTGDSIIAAPVICYESIYGEYVGEYIRKGANLICIMTNDGWWQNTPGYRQHCQYARLRAIEQRRDIARSANTGTSCFINQLGDISQATEWWVPTAIKANVNLNNEITFYGHFGDYLSKIALFLSIIILTVFTIINRRNKIS